MSGLSHTTNHTRFPGMKLNWQSLPAVWPLKRSKPDQVETALQIFTEDEPLPSSRRLVVIVPDASIDFFNLPKRIRNLASPDRRQVLLLTKPCREENEFHLRLNLTTLAAMIRDSRVVVQTQLVLGMSIEQAVRQQIQPDDILVCFEEHRIACFLKKNQLAEILAKKTHLPVYTLKGPVSEMAEPISARLIDFLLLAVCLVSMIGFFALQVWIDRNSAGTIRMILQILVVFAEVWVVAGCANRSFKI